MGWMQVEPQQRNAHPTKDQSGSMNLPTSVKERVKGTLQNRLCKLVSSSEICEAKPLARTVPATHWLNIVVIALILQRSLQFCRPSMSVISVRVPKKLKDQMSRMEEDWPRYIRQMIEEKIKRHEMGEASKIIDQIRSKTKRGVYNASKMIREDRERRWVTIWGARKLLTLVMEMNCDSA